MSDTINIGGITVSKFYLGGSSDVKIYLGTTKLYPHLQEPCFAVVGNISTYTARTYVDVYETSSDKWYKLNNLSAYEEYGLYGSSTATTYYDGKLSVYDGYEYMYSGSSWQNIGEISGSSRVPIGYTEVEYIENESVAYINTSFKPNQDTRVIARMQTVTSMMHARFLGAGAWNGSNGYQFDYENYSDGQLHISWGGINGWSTYNYYGDYNVHTYDWNKNVFTIDNGVFSAETTYTSFQCTDNLGLFVHIYNGEPCGDSTPWTETYERSFLHGRLYSCQIYDNGTLIRDLVPCTRDSDSKVGVYDIVNDVFYSSAYSGYEFTAGSASTSVIYPLYYPVMQDPPNNLSFSSMTEAEEYECPWVGMEATIDGDRYIFSGDSQSGYEWVEVILPYTELQWIEMPQTSPYCAVQLVDSYSGTSYLYYDFELLFNTLQDVRIIGFDSYAYMVSYGGSSIFLQLSRNTAQFNVSNQFTSGVKYHFGLGKRNSTSNNTFDNLDTSTTYATFNTSLLKTKKPYFGAINQGSTLLVNGESERIYSIKVYDNEVLVGNYIPVKRNSDNFVTLYDTVSEQFCDTVGGGTMVAGPTV